MRRLPLQAVHGIGNECTARRPKPEGQTSLNPSRNGYQLQPFTQPTYAELQRRLQDVETWQPYSWFGFDYTGTPASAHTPPPFGEGGFLALVNADHDLVGQVQWVPGFWYGGPSRHRGWNFGALILPEYRRTRATSSAIQLLIDYLFTHTTAHRLEATTPAQAFPRTDVLETVGLKHEGVMRAAQWREGKWHDMAMYSILRHEWEDRQSKENT